MQVITICQMVYGIPSLLLLIFFFILPFPCRQQLSSPFYKVLQVDILVNILCYTNTWIAIRLEHFEIGTQFLIFLEQSIPNTLTITRLFVSAFFHMQNVTGLSLVLYRFTSVQFLTSDQKWKSWYLCVPVFGTLYSFAVLTPWWYFGPLVTTVKIADGKIQKTIDKKGLFTHATVNPVFSAFYFLMILLLGVWTTMRLEEKGQKSRSNRHKHFVRRLTRIIVCNSILMSGNLLLLIVIGIAYLFVPPASILQIQMIVVTFTSDMVTLAMPYILFTFDSNIRRLLNLEPSKIPIGMTSCSGRTITNYVVNN